MTPRPTARVYRGTARNLAFLAGRLRAGQLVAVPTETVYGLAADALDARACAKIFRAKDRPVQDPLIVHIHSMAQLDLLAEANDAARRLAAVFWPGPLTLVLPKKNSVPAIVTAGLPSVAVRMPRHPLMRRLLRLCDRPLAAPSANPFGYVSPTTAGHVRDGLGQKIRFILDGGPAAIGLESTILDLRDPRRPQLLRPGAVTRARIESVLGCKLRTPAIRHAPKNAPLPAPGLMARHYSPHTPLVLHKKIALRQVEGGGIGEAWLFFSRPDQPTGPNVFWFDSLGDQHSAGRRLFGLLRSLDRMGFQKIHVELAARGDLAEAINDRLHRAAGSRRKT